MNTCVKCEKTFETWSEYQEHISLNCIIGNVEIAAHDEIHDTRFKMPQPIKLQEWKGPMDPKLKAVLVARGEARLGAEFFIGQGR